MAAATLSQPNQDTRQNTPERNFRVQEIALEWRFSVDTIQRLFVGEPDVFVIRSGRKTFLSIPQQVKDRVWRRMTNKRVM
jgi:hypothetical protein